MKNKTSFPKGKSGNPRGRPKGSKNSTTILKEALKQDFDKALQKDFSKIMKAIVDKAKEGDMVAAKMILDRVVPVTKAIDFGAKGGENLGITIKVENMATAQIDEQPAIDVTPTKGEEVH